MLGEKQIQIANLFDVFPPSEGMITQIYGRIGSGKSYATVRIIFDHLRRGKVCYVNFPINFTGYDERKSRFRIVVSLIFPWIKRFYYFPPENLRFFEISDEWAKKQGYENFTKWVHSRTDCDIFADEGHVWVDSYTATRMPIELRNISLHTRHYNRNIFIISQRPTAIHVTMRANVNVFYKCEKIFQLGRIVRFKVSEYQDLKNETVDEDEELRVSKKYYWGRKRFFDAYDTRYLRKGAEVSQYPAFEAYRLNFLGKMAYLLGVRSKKAIPKLSTHTAEPKKLIVQNVEPKAILIPCRTSTNGTRRAKKPVSARGTRSSATKVVAHTAGLGMSDHK